MVGGVLRALVLGRGAKPSRAVAASNGKILSYFSASFTGVCKRGMKLSDLAKPREQANPGIALSFGLVLRVQPESNSYMHIRASEQLIRRTALPPLVTSSSTALHCINRISLF